MLLSTGAMDRSGHLLVLRKLVGAYLLPSGLGSVLYHAIGMMTVRLRMGKG